MSWPCSVLPSPALRERPQLGEPLKLAIFTADNEFLPAVRGKTGSGVRPGGSFEGTVGNMSRREEVLPAAVGDRGLQRHAPLLQTLRDRTRPAQALRPCHMCSLPSGGGGRSRGLWAREAAPACGRGGRRLTSRPTPTVGDRAALRPFHRSLRPPSAPPQPPGSWPTTPQRQLTRDRPPCAASGAPRLRTVRGQCRGPARAARQERGSPRPSGPGVLRLGAGAGPKEDQCLSAGTLTAKPSLSRR